MPEEGNKKVEKYFIKLAVVTVVFLILTFLWHGFSFVWGKEEIESISKSFLLWTFLVAALYFFLYVLVVCSNAAEFFGETAVNGRILVFAVLFGGALFGLIILGFVAKLDWMRDSSSIFLIALPSALLAFLAAVFDLVVVDFPGFRRVGLAARSEWRPIFVEATKNDIAVCICFIFLLFMAFVAGLVGVEGDNSSAAMAFITGGEAFVLFMSTLLFAIESVAPYWKHVLDR